MHASITQYSHFETVPTQMYILVYYVCWRCTENYNTEYKWEREKHFTASTW